MNSQLTKQQEALVMLPELWWAGVNAVRGDVTVRQYCESHPFTGPIFAIAIGKVAESMMQGLIDSGADIKCGLVICKEGLRTENPISAACIETMVSSHPIPDDRSLAAGDALINFVDACDAQAHLVMLVSGGASALAEQLVSDYAFGDLQRRTDSMIKAGAKIEHINMFRRTVSDIKGGRLFARFKGKQWTTLAISDVEGDVPGNIGSGIGCCPEELSGDARFKHVLVGTNKAAREAVRTAAEQRGRIIAHNEETLYGDVPRLARIITDKIRRVPVGLSIFGGESVITLPAKPGVGGRNQSLALALAIAISGEKDIAMLMAGTDGNDGSTAAAGGLITGKTAGQLNHAHAALKKADAGTYLAKQESLFVTGPTHTNVMDLLIAYRW